jgi:hypothetical protein
MVVTGLAAGMEQATTFCTPFFIQIYMSGMKNALPISDMRGRARYEENVWILEKARGELFISNLLRIQGQNLVSVKQRE